MENGYFAIAFPKICIIRIEYETFWNVSLMDILIDVTFPVEIWQKLLINIGYGEYAKTFSIM